jgi:hypothetical protein
MFPYADSLLKNPEKIELLLPVVLEELEELEEFAERAIGIRLD